MSPGKGDKYPPVERISDERLSMLKQYHRHSVSSLDEDTWSALGELERARELEKQLRSLVSEVYDGRYVTAENWRQAVICILHAHGSAS
jgi:hypothetical protein